MVSSAKPKYGLMWWGRVVFVVLAIGLGAWAVAESWDEVVLAVRGVSPLAIFVALLFTIAGTVMGGIIWVRFVSTVGSPMSIISGSQVFFVGQLGKYLPGGVWNFVALGVAGRSLGLSPRVAVGAGFFLLYILVISGGVAIASGAHTAIFVGGFPSYLFLIAILGAVIALLPPFINRAANSLLRLGTPPQFTPLKMVEFFMLGASVWVLYGLGVALLVPDEELFGYFSSGYFAAFAFAFLAGLFVPVAPAGLGIREAALVWTLSNAIGPPEAIAVALVSRLLHTIADFVVAGGAAFAAELAKKRD